MLKYFLGFVLLLAISVFVTSQYQKYTHNPASPSKNSGNAAIASANPPKPTTDAEDAQGDHPRWYLAYLVFGWPNGITVWALFFTLMALAEQTGQTRKAADAALLNAQALVNAERARIGFDVSEMGRSFQIDGKNSGKTSARIMYAHGFTVTLAPEESLPSVPVYVGAPDDSSEWIGPTEKFDLLTVPDRYGFVADLSDIALCERIRDKKSVLWAFGCIRYFDGVSPDQREKRFCFFTSVDQRLETYMYPAGPEIYRLDT